MSDAVKKAIVAKVQFGTFEIDGLLFEDGSYGVKLPDGFNPSFCYQFKSTAVVFFFLDGQLTVLDFEGTYMGGNIYNFFYTHEGIVRGTQGLSCYIDLLDYLDARFELTDKEAEALAGVYKEENKLEWAFTLGTLLTNLLPKKAIVNPEPNKCTKKANGYIYMFELDGCLKIGFSTNIEKRAKAFSVSNNKVDLLYYKKATLQQELCFHRKHNNSSEKYPLDRKNELLSLLKTI